MSRKLTDAERTDRPMDADYVQLSDERKKAVSAVAIALACLFMLAALFFVSGRRTLVMQYRLPDTDINAVLVPGASEPGSMPSEGIEGGYSGSVSYMGEATVDLSAGRADLMFDNPSGSGTAMVVHMIVDGKEIGKTGLLNPGYGVRVIENIDASGFVPGDYEGSFQVDHYDVNTGEKAIFKLDADITVHVVESADASVSGGQEGIVLNPSDYE